MEPFAPRKISFHGLREVRGWRIKLYSVLYGPGPLDWDGFEAGLMLADDALPEPAITKSRPGVGFSIAHQGRTGDYVVLGWWDNENELPLRVFVRRDRGGSWRPAQESESVCVWDLEILWAERQTYVMTMLRADGSRPEEYLARNYRTEGVAPR